MNIVRFPFRVYFRWNDFKEFYLKKNATIVSFTIDKYCYITLEVLPYYKAKYRLSWAKLEEQNL